jgi:hypothetical protein
MDFAHLELPDFSPIRRPDFWEAPDPSNPPSTSSGTRTERPSLIPLTGGFAIQRLSDGLCDGFSRLPPPARCCHTIVRLSDTGTALLTVVNPVGLFCFLFNSTHLVHVSFKLRNGRHRRHRLLSSVWLERPTAPPRQVCLRRRAVGKSFQRIALLGHDGRSRKEHAALKIRA